MIKLKQLVEQKDTCDSAGVMYFYGEQLLCCLGTKGTWGIPKGHIQENEKPIDGAIRELSEETQIILNGTPELTNVVMKKNGGKLFVFSLKGDKRYVPRLNHEHIDWGYFLPENLPQPFDIKILKCLERLNESNTGRTNLIFERIDYHQMARHIVDKHGLKSKIKFGVTGSNRADYNWKTDTINLRRSYPSVKEFLITVLHEIHHALQRKKLGTKKYEKQYQRAGDLAVHKGKDFHDDNKFEEDAERSAKKEVHKWM